MAEKLELHISVTIVRRALAAVQATGDMAPEDVLGDLIPNEAQRVEFRHAIRTYVRENNFDIDPEVIPIFSNTKLRDVTHAVAMSALPGDPYTTKPDDVPPPPPPSPNPKVARPIVDEPKKKYEESN
jgi:hypothetical protein